jgi:hypothetical protein
LIKRFAFTGRKRKENPDEKRAKCRYDMNRKIIAVSE